MELKTLDLTDAERDWLLEWVMVYPDWQRQQWLYRRLAWWLKRRERRR